MAEGLRGSKEELDALTDAYTNYTKQNVHVHTNYTRQQAHVNTNYTRHKAPVNTNYTRQNVHVHTNYEITLLLFALFSCDSSGRIFFLNLNQSLKIRKTYQFPSQP